MAKASRPRSSRDKVRALLRAKGLRQVEIWVPDMNSPAFRQEAHRQSLAIAMSAGEAGDQAFVDAVSEWDET